MTAPDNQNNSEWEPRPMASDVEKRIAKALLSARSHIGSCRPDYDEDDAAWWDELTELAELVTQPAVGEAITSNASLAGEAVAWTTTKPTVPGAYWVRGYAFRRPTEKALVEVREVGGELCSNLHATNSDDEDDVFGALTVHSDRFEWLGPLTTHPPAGEAVAWLPSAHEWLSENRGDASQDWIDGWDACRNRWQSITHPPAAEVREVDEAMVGRAQTAWYAAGSAPCSTARDWMRAALIAALQKEKVND